MSDDEKRLVSLKHVQDIQIGVSDFDPNDRVLAIQLTKSLIENQTHVYYHVPSCIKKTNSTLCRYHFPQAIVETTGFNAAGIFQMQRRPGNQWLNSYIPVWRQCFRDNMDATLICDGSGAQKTLYCTKYATKHQSLIDNVHVIEMAYAKKVKREDPSTDGYRRGLGRLLSLAYSSSGSVEIGGPLATHYILQGEAAYFSHEFTPMLLTQALNLIDEDKVQSILERVGDHYKLSSGIYDYMYRDERLENVSFYVFCAWYHKKQKTRQADILGFTQDHSQAETHMLERRLTRRIPEIIGPRLPDNRGLEDPETEEKYYRMVLCLYRSFRHPKEHVRQASQNVPAREVFTHWLGNLNGTEQADIKRHLQFHQEYHFAMDSAKLYYATMRETNKTSDCTSSDIDTESAHRHYDDVTSERSRETTRFENMWLYLEDDDVDTTHGEHCIDDEEESNTTEVPLDLRHLMPPLPQQHAPRSPNYVLGTTVQPRSIKSFTKELDQIATSSNTNCTSTTNDDTVKVATLDQIMQELCVDVSRHAVTERPFPTVNDVSMKFSLNELQHVAFTRFAVPLLHKFQNIPFDRWDTTPLYITGAGGTGKSRIVEAIQYLCKSWGRPNGIRIMAPTGVAAAALGGTTVHSAVFLPINVVTLPSRLQHPSGEMLEKWLGVCGAVMDELSIVGKHMHDDLKWTCRMTY